MRRSVTTAGICPPRSIKHKQLAWAVAALGIMSFATGANAANKTGITDTLRAGEMRLDLYYALTGLTPGGTYTLATQSSTLSGSTTQNTLTAAYLRGITDTLSLQISYDIFHNTSQEFDYTLGSTQYVSRTRWEGGSAPEIGLQYSLSDKHQNGVGALVYGSFTPASPYSAPTSEIKTNGTVTTTGIPGNAGNASDIKRAGATLSFPVNIGEIFTNLNYFSGVHSLSSRGEANSELSFGFERRLGDTSKFRPYIRFNSIGSCYSETGQSDFYRCFDLGLHYIKDYSKSLSLELMGQFGTVHKLLVDTTSSGNLNLSLTGYNVGLRAMYFY